MAGKAERASSVNILGVDVGSTIICCYVFDELCKEKGRAQQPILLEHPGPGRTEIDPEILWEQFQSVINEALSSASISAKDVTSLGLSVQRGSFVTWDRDTGKPLHKIIGWQDLRSTQLCTEWNNSFTMRGIKAVTKILYALTGNNRYKAASVIKFFPNHVTLRLLWLFKTDQVAYEKACDGSLLFGTIDTWLIWKMSNGTAHITDYSNASSTGIFDTYRMEWSTFFCKILGLPMSIFPSLVDTAGKIINVDENIFGASFPVTGLVADQQASVFGQCCFEEGDINCTLGTGTFIDINTGRKPHASVGGLYPLVGWKVGDDVSYIAEGHACGTAASIEWSKRIGLFDDVSETSDMAFSVSDSNGSYFIPAFDGLNAPINDHNACTMLIGIQKTTTKAHIVRAVLESIAFRFYQLYQIVIDEIRIPVMSSIKADGGVTNNDFVVELISSMTEHVTDRSAFSDMSAVGAAYFAGLGIGVWESKDELRDLVNSKSSFKPNREIREKYNLIFHTWTKAVQRCLGWYQQI